MTLLKYGSNISLGSFNRARQGHYNNTYNDNTYNDFPYNDITYNNFNHNDITYNT